MDTTIKQVSSVEYELEISATPEDLSPDFNKALKAQKARTSMKGFRPGKVPISLVKRLYGEGLAFGVAERSIQETFESEIVKSGEHDLIGAPKVLDMVYAMDGDLRAVVRFGVRPTFDVTRLAGQKLSRLVHEVGEDEVEIEVNRLREREGELIVVEQGAQAEDFVSVDLQRLDEATRTPLIGQRREDVMFHLNDERLRPEFREALIGRTAGEVVPVDREPQASEGDDPSPYSVEVKEVKRLSLPDLDDAFVARITKDKFDTLDALREDVRETLERHWKERSEELLKGQVIERLIELNSVDVPESLVDMFLDSFLDDLSRNHGELPKDFDVPAFRESRREEAVRQSRWMLVKDNIVEDDGLEIEDVDRQAHFEESAGEGSVDPEMLRKYYESVSGMMGRLDSRLLTDKVFEDLLADVELVDKDSDAYKAEFEARSD